jgi:hypothetical protein
MKKKGYAILVTVLISLTQVQAQDFGLGFRISSHIGITGQYFLSSDRAIEGQMNYNNYGLDFVGLYEVHRSLGEPGWRWYYGGGAHISTWNHSPDNSLLIGVDGIIGIEYMFAQVPLALSIDLKPAFDLVASEDPFVSHNYVGIGLRYFFKKHAAAITKTI